MTWLWWLLVTCVVALVAGIGLVFFRVFFTDWD